MTKCNHCGGTGEEPDPIRQAFELLLAAVDELEDGAAVAVGRAANAYRDVVQARVTFLEAALRDMLGHLSLPARRSGTAFIASFQAPYSQLDGWYAILEGKPGGPGFALDARTGYVVSERGKVTGIMRADGSVEPQ